MVRKPCDTNVEEEKKHVSAVFNANRPDSGRRSQAGFRPRGDGRLDGGHRNRVLRQLLLLDRRRELLWNGLLHRRGEAEPLPRDAVLVRDLRRVVSRPPAWVPALWSLWGQARSQEDPGGGLAHDGHLHLRRGRSSGLRRPRSALGRAPVRLPCVPGAWPGWRVVGRRACRHGERARQQACAVGLLPQPGCPPRLLLRLRREPRA